MSDTTLAAIAAGQGALVTRQQALMHLSRRQLDSRLATGRLISVRWGVYRFAGAPVSRWEALRAACLAGGPAAVASFLSAAAVWGVTGVVEPEQPEITTPWPQWPRLPGVTSHQSSRLPVQHCAVHDGVPVTTVARTLVDLSKRYEARELGWVVDGCLRRGQVALVELHEVYQWLAKPGRHGLDAIAEVLQRRPVGYNPRGSGAELDLAQILVEAGLPRPVQQHQVAAGGTVYLLDHAYLDTRVGMEYDEWAFHRLPSDLDRAARRNNALRLEGWTMLHFTAASGPNQIVRDVRAARAAALRANAPAEV